MLEIEKKTTTSNDRHLIDWIQLERNSELEDIAIESSKARKQRE